MVQTKFDFINNMLLYPALNNFPVQPKHNPRLSICLHSSIVEKWANVLHKMNLTRVSDVFEHNLQIGENCFDMRITHVTLGKGPHRHYLNVLIENSQVSFPWEKNPTLFINKESFYILKKFIAIHKLDVHTVKIEEQSGISANHDTIKVVTFNRCVNELSIIDKYKTYLKSFETYRQPQYYYMTYAFLWQQPLMLKHFHIPIDDEFHSVILIVLNRLGKLKYANELNIFDLLMIRLAICDNRKPFFSRIVKYEIDFMIKRELFKYIKNNNLDLEQYLIANNCTQREMLFGYLIYEFQNYFETIATSNRLGLLRGKEYSLKSKKVNRVFDLVHEMKSDEKQKTEKIGIVEKLKQNTNIEFDIDGRNYDQMSLSLFLDLVVCHNVRQIDLDTNNRWISNASKLNISTPNHKIIVNLVGENTYNFIEDFVSSLKNIKWSRKIWLKINGSLNDYRIFDDLKIHILEFAYIKIDARLLDGLQKCAIKSNISFFDCTFENTRQCWAQLNTLRALKDVRIVEEQDTWQPLFEFISNELETSNSKEFRFNCTKHLVIISPDANINLKGLIFTHDEVNGKLEIRNKMDNQPIDLYDLKFGLQSDDKSDYDFYQ